MWPACTASTPPKTVVEQGRRRCEAEGSPTASASRLADACQTGLPGGCADFVWGEDAWCYVVDKPRLIAEAVRLLKPRRRHRFHRLGRRPDAVDRRRGGALSHVHEVPQYAAARRLRRAAGRGGMRSAGGGRYRPLRAARRPVPQHAEHAVDLRRPADYRLRHGADANRWAAK